MDCVVLMRKACDMSVVTDLEQGEEHFLSRDEASRFLRISQRTFDGLYASGKIPAVRIGRRVTFSREDLVRFANSCKA